METTVLQRIRDLLQRSGVPYEEQEHEATRTSREAAAARGEPMNIGAKALLLKADDRFCLFVLAADRQIHSAALRRHLGVQRTRFATVEELRRLTGLVPGCVPPFGEPVLPFPLYADESAGAEGRVAFNAGSLTHSIMMSTADWEAVARPKRFRFARG